MEMIRLTELTVRRGHDITLEGLEYNSVENDFIPVLSLSSGTLLTKGDEKVYCYKKISLPNIEIGYHDEILRYPKLVEYFYNYSNLIVFCTHRGQDPKKYIVTKGAIYYNGIPLVMMTIKSRYIYTLDRNNIDYSQFSLLVDHNLLNSPEHTLFYKNLKKYLITEQQEQGIDVIYTNDINKWVYTPTLNHIPKFGNIKEMLSHLGELNNLLVND